MSMGYRDYMKGNCPEAVYGDENDEESESFQFISSSLKEKINWDYSPNGYCEVCKVVVYEDKGRCPDCNRLTKNKYHWQKKVKIEK